MRSEETWHSHCISYGNKCPESLQYNVEKPTRGQADGSGQTGSKKVKSRLMLSTALARSVYKDEPSLMRYRIESDSQKDLRYKIYN
jgi:hypothetical protein